MKYSFDDLKGRNAVITGGFGVIGLALTKGLLEAGVNVAVISRSKDNPARGEALASEFGGGVKCLGISASTLDKAALEEARELIHKELGPIDILINCAGGNSPKATCAVEQMDADTELSKSFYGLDMQG
ncbi:MAG: SDR family NAD(P)-dependent oxidoreductase, partial [Bacteroidales bacterium]|nr:SDR family NAD(P)-dependent oxidoreductase [Bacteroidales bacterium]